jgi:hypothetical protein
VYLQTDDIQVGSTKTHLSDQGPGNLGLTGRLTDCSGLGESTAIGFFSVLRAVHFENVAVQRALQRLAEAAAARKLSVRNALHFENVAVQRAHGSGVGKPLR